MGIGVVPFPRHSCWLLWAKLKWLPALESGSPRTQEVELGGVPPPLFLELVVWESSALS